METDDLNIESSSGGVQTELCADTKADVYFRSRFPAKLPNGRGGEADESQTCRSAGMSPGLVVL